jgi:hypothetical protein
VKSVLPDSGLQLCVSDLLPSILNKQQVTHDLRAPADRSSRLRKNSAPGRKARPQGLKPDVFSIIYGPTKVVPDTKPEFFPQLPGITLDWVNAFVNPMGENLQHSELRLLATAKMMEVRRRSTSDGLDPRPSLYPSLLPRFNDFSLCLTRVL